MIPIVSFVGESGCGKTTLVEKVIAELTAKGFKTSSIKYTRHEFDPDSEGKDSWRHTRAGAVATALVTPGKTAVYVPHDEIPAAAHISFRFFTDADIVVAEGGAEQDTPKIIFYAKGCEERFPLSEAVALIGGGSDAVDLPVFSRDDSQGVADFIVKTFLKEHGKNDVRVWLDGKPLMLKPFVKAFVSQTIKGMLSSLKGGKKPERIHIRIGR